MSYDTSDQVEMPPVTDWVNDWDWLDDQWGPNAIEIWNSVRDQCPMATTERYGRAFMPVTMDAVAAVANDTEHFSSIWVNVGRPDAPRRPAPPITSDPPDHHGHRRLLLPSFSPKKIAVMEDELREFCRGLIAELDGCATADAAAQYSQHIPVHGICMLTGIPEQDADLFRDWIHRNFQLAPRDNAVRLQVVREMTEYIDALLRDRLANPADDMLTMIANAEIDGEPVDWELKLGYVRLLIVAGIDTTWSAIGSSLWHLAGAPSDLQRLQDEPALWPTAIEEFLRAYAPVTMARMVAKDHDFNGCPMKQDEWVLLPFPAANLDPAEFERADEVLIDREVNRHAAFGLGIHRCLGSNLARLEVRVAVQTFVERFPEFTLADPAAVRWSVGQIRGPRELPVRVLRRA